MASDAVGLALLEATRDVLEELQRISPRQQNSELSTLLKKVQDEVTQLAKVTKLDRQDIAKMVSSVMAEHTAQLVQALEAAGESKSKLTEMVLERISSMNVEVNVPASISSDGDKPDPIRSIRVGNIERDFGGNITSADFQVLRG